MMLSPIHQLTFSIKLCILALIFSTWGCSHPPNEQPPIPHPKLSEIDPTDSTVGLGERITSNGVRLVDSALPKIKKPAFKIVSDNSEVIKVNQGDSTPVQMKILTKNQTVSNVLLGWADEKKYASLPVIHQDSGKVTFCLRLDSSVQPGLFEVLMACMDSNSHISNIQKKWVVVRGKPVNIDSLIVGRWRVLKSNDKGDHRGHFVQFNSRLKYGEWWEPSYYKDNFWMQLSFLSRETAPNWQDSYQVIRDSLSLRDGEIPGAQYRVLGITSKRLLLREYHGGLDRYWVLNHLKQ